MTGPNPPGTRAVPHQPRTLVVGRASASTGSTSRDLPAPTEGSITVAPWIDDRVEAIGHDPRSSYVELFWLGILGPSSTLLLRRLSAGLVHSPEGFRLPVADTALGMGLGVPVGRNSPFIRALHRCCQFRLARWDDEQLAVRRKVPPLRPGQVKRLPASLQHAHAAQLEREVQARTHRGTDDRLLSEPAPARRPGTRHNQPFEPWWGGRCRGRWVRSVHG